MVPAGKPVDSVIESFAPHLAPGDLLIDGGNSFYRDTQRRQADLDARGLHFMGMGVSGGEDGARHGPSMMPGGPIEAYRHVAPVLEKMAAHVDGEPCVAHLGAGAAGHYVKMVHNGIEYAMMQLLAEAYDLLKRGTGMDNARLAEVFGEWNRGPLDSFLMEITADILGHPDPEGVDIDAAPPELEPAEALGTESHRTDVPTEARIGATTQRCPLPPGRDRGHGQAEGDRQVDEPGRARPGHPDADHRRRRLGALRVCAQDRARRRGRPAGRAGAPARTCRRPRSSRRSTARSRRRSTSPYAQGFALLREASTDYGFGLDLATVATIWRGGCIIRAAMLETFREAFAAQPDARQPARHAGTSPRRCATARRRCARRSRRPPRRASRRRRSGASLAYLDSYRSAWLPANLVQAQRDYFGAHTFQRTDRDGTFHGQWMPAGM